jgi:hypothetical protein
MFVGQNKIVDSVITLRFDKFLNPKPKKTTIYLGSVIEGNVCQKNSIDLLSVYQHHGIDIDNFNVIHDLDILKKYNQFGLYGTFNFWIRQQLIKCMAINDCSDEQILIQDSDIWLTKPYCCFNNNNPVPFVIPDTAHSPEYYDFVLKFTGSVRQTTDCFVTDFMPLRKTDWLSLKTQIEYMYQAPWLSAMIGVMQQTAGNLMFSEYELLGNWMLLNNPDLSTVIQNNYLLTELQIPMIKNKNFVDTNFDSDAVNAIAVKIYNKKDYLTFSDVEYCTEIFMPH